MAIKKESRTIGDHTYEVTQFPTTKALTMLNRLVCLLGESIGTMTDDGGFSSAAKTLIGRLEGEDLAEFCQSLLEKVTIDGQKQQGEKYFDLHFAGQIGHLFEVVAFVLEVNFNDFLSVLKTAFQAAMIQQAAMMKEVVESNPLSDQVIPEESPENS